MRSGVGEIAVFSRADLIAGGLTSWKIDREVRAGRLVRLRRDHYVVDSTDAVDRAVRIGARLSCVSLLAFFGVFVFDASDLHVQVGRLASRLRAADDRFRSWVRSEGERAGVRLHWHDLHEIPPARHVVAVVDAVRTAIICQTPRHAVATLDSALHRGVVTMAELSDVFATLPDRYRVLLSLVDGRCESGPETLVRLMLRRIGADVRVQRRIDGVGRVDFLVDGWLLIECDSRAFHDGWEQARRDRARDIAAARRGFTTVRPVAEDILYRPEQVHADLAAILATRR